jgi:hypothetical protein
MSPEHPLEFRLNPNSNSNNSEHIPYIMIRNNLWAKLNQSVYYQLVDLAKEVAGDFFITSGDYQVEIPQ